MFELIPALKGWAKVTTTLRVAIAFAPWRHIAVTNLKPET